MIREAMMALADAADSANHIQMPLAWVLAIVGSLATVVTVLAKLLWSITNEQIKTLRNEIERQRVRISKLEKGCGAPACAWRTIS